MLVSKQDVVEKGDNFRDILIGAYGLGHENVDKYMNVFKRSSKKEQEIVLKELEDCSEKFGILNILDNFYIKEADSLRGRNFRKIVSDVYSKKDDKLRRDTTAFKESDKEEQEVVLKKLEDCSEKLEILRILDIFFIRTTYCQIKKECDHDREVPSLEICLDRMSNAERECLLEYLHNNAKKVDNVEVLKSTFDKLSLRKTSKFLEIIVEYDKKQYKEIFNSANEEEQEVILDILTKLRDRIDKLSKPVEKTFGASGAAVSGKRRGKKEKSEKNNGGFENKLDLVIQYNDDKLLVIFHGSKFGLQKIKTILSKQGYVGSHKKSVKLFIVQVDLALNILQYKEYDDCLSFIKSKVEEISQVGTLQLCQHKLISALGKVVDDRGKKEDQYKSKRFVNKVFSIRQEEMREKQEVQKEQKQQELEKEKLILKSWDEKERRMVVFIQEIREATKSIMRDGRRVDLVSEGEDKGSNFRYINPNIDFQDALIKLILVLERVSADILGLDIILAAFGYKDAEDLEKILGEKIVVVKKFEGKNALIIGMMFDGEPLDAEFPTEKLKGIFDGKLMSKLNDYADRGNSGNISTDYSDEKRESSFSDYLVKRGKRQFEKLMGGIDLCHNVSKYRFSDNYIEELKCLLPNGFFYGNFFDKKSVNHNKKDLLFGNMIQVIMLYFPCLVLGIELTIYKSLLSGTRICSSHFVALEDCYVRFVKTNILWATELLSNYLEKGMYYSSPSSEFKLLDKPEAIGATCVDYSSNP